MYIGKHTFYGSVKGYNLELTPTTQDAIFNHQDDSTLVGSPYEPAFVTVTGLGGSPNIYPMVKVHG